MEKFTFGLGVAGLGMIVVFAGLVLLIGFITILGVAAKERKKPAPKTEQKAESVAAPPVQTAVAADGVSPPQRVCGAPCKARFQRARLEACRT